MFSRVRNYLWVVGVLLLGIILLSVDISRITSILLAANPYWILLAIAATVATIIGKGLKWQSLLFEKKQKVSAAKSTKLFLKGFFLSVVTPGRIGDFSRAFFLRNTVGFVFALASVVLDRAIDILMLLVLSFLALTAFFGLYGTWIVNPGFILAGLFFLLAGMLYVLKQKQRGFFREVLFAFIPKKYEKKVRVSYEELVFNLRNRIQKPVSLWLAIALGTVNWALSILTGFSIGLALGIAQPVYFFAILVLLLALIDIIPISIGGIGTREAGAILLFAAVRETPEIAVAFSLLYFFTGYILPGIIGGLLFLKKPLSG